VFNPNKFTYLDISTIIYASREKRLGLTEIENLRKQVIPIYQWLIKDSKINLLGSVFRIQTRIIQFARGNCSQSKTVIV